MRTTHAKLGSKASRPLPERRRVALIVETSLAPGREILRGIGRYMREGGGPWSLTHEPRSLHEQVPCWLERWQGDGVVARVHDQLLADSLRAKGLPTVDVLGVVERTHFPLVHVADAAIGRMGAEHLLDQGYRRLSFVGIEGENWSNARREAFSARALEAGASCYVHTLPWNVARRAGREEAENGLVAWLEALPKPAGLMLASDQLGPDTLEATRRAGILVPDDVGVIGVDNDGPLCEVSDPPLSSVWPDHRRVGYEAARLLSELMRGAPALAEPLLLPPIGVVRRRSTDALAMDDRGVTDALRYIRAHACDSIEVQDVVGAVPLSRSVLQRRFRALLGRSVHEEIVRVRVARARELLTDTDLPLAEVAERAGFRHQEYMGAVFRRLLRQTPGAIRREALHGLQSPADLSESTKFTSVLAAGT